MSSQPARALCGGWLTQAIRLKGKGGQHVDCYRAVISGPKSRLKGCNPTRPSKFVEITPVLSGTCVARGTRVQADNGL